MHLAVLDFRVYYYAAIIYHDPVKAFSISFRLSRHPITFIIPLTIYLSYSFILRAQLLCFNTRKALLRFGGILPTGPWGSRFMQCCENLLYHSIRRFTSRNCILCLQG